MLLVASIPIAMQVVCATTMAVGAHALARRKAIVSRLNSIEELAGVQVLCSDKTGTLTKNELTVEVPRLIGNTTASDIFLAALAAKREGGNQDAIDKCITEMAVKTQSLMHTRKRTLSPSIRKSSVQRLLFATKVLAKRSK